MKKTSLYTVTVLSFSSALLDFLMMPAAQTVFTRDRLIHIFISAAFGAAAIIIFKNFTYENAIVKTIAVSVLFLRALLLCKNFVEYFHTFHGSNTVGIVLFSAIIVFMFWSYIYEKTHLMYSFFMIFNITLTVLIVVLSFKNLNAANIYSNSHSFELSTGKMFVFFDIFTISVIVKDKKQRQYVQKNYLMLSSLFFIFITVIQGLCLSGNILYSVSPLQALSQTFFTETIKRYDYIFTIYYTLDYYAAIMLYAWSIKTLISVSKENINENS